MIENYHKFAENNACIVENLWWDSMNLVATIIKTAPQIRDFPSKIYTVGNKVITRVIQCLMYTCAVIVEPPNKGHF